MDRRAKRKRGEDPNEPDDIQRVFHPEDFTRILRLQKEGKEMDEEDQRLKEEIEKGLEYHLMVTKEMTGLD